MYNVLYMHKVFYVNVSFFSCLVSLVVREIEIYVNIRSHIIEKVQLEHQQPARMLG